MKRWHVALIAAVLSLTTGVGLATAAVPSVGSQTVDQSASSGQVAGAAAGAAQTNPSNTNVSIRVLSPGNDGSVSQSNSVDSDATASNRNSADQDATQSQSGGSTGACCGSGSTGIQSSSQTAANQQAAAALSLATQRNASNTNVPVRVGSPGNDGSVSQSNSVDSDASASNRNSADQDATQTQSSGGGTCCQSGSTGIQTSDQNAENAQAALAASEAKQVNPKNTNVTIRVLSPGNDGNVSQTNSVDSDADAHNSNSADQDATQRQSSGGSDCHCAGSTGIQTSDQDAKNEQAALAGSKAEQIGASNTNASIRVLSPGNDGNVRQSNTVDSDARASNRNSADQDATQTQSAGSGSGTGIQVSDQDAKSEQAALAASIAKQDHPSNTNTPIRVLSPGNGGNVIQSNSVDSDASAKNSNDADQTANQTQSGGGSCGCQGSTGIQIADQSAKNEQLALGFSAAEQKGAKNSNEPIRVGSYGNDGDVWQTNSVDSDAEASNKNDVEQDTTQTQSAGSGSGTGIQVSDQSSKNEQAALAASIAKQDHAKNDNSPIRVLSPGNGGKVVQSNSVDSDASAKNSNDVDQTVDQTQRGGSSDCKCHDGSTGIQIADQSAKNEQLALGFSAAEQKGAKNSNDPIRVGSYGNDGDVWQTNSVDSDAKASNKNDVDQDTTQTQSAGSGSGTGIQISGQESKNEQAALAASIATQQHAKNDNSPIRVLSPGNGGKVVQSNSVDSDASAKNSNDVDQTVDQTQRGGSATASATTARRASRSPASPRRTSSSHSGSRQRPRRTRRTRTIRSGSRATATTATFGRPTASTVTLRPPTRTTSSRTRPRRSRQGPARVSGSRSQARKRRTTRARSRSRRRCRTGRRTRTSRSGF